MEKRTRFDSLVNNLTTKMGNKAIIQEDALNVSNIINEMWSGSHFGY